MAAGPWLTGVATITGLAAVLYAFTNNASPYGNFSDARKAGGDRFYVKGVVDKATIFTDLSKGGLTTFQLTDMAGEKQKVFFHGTKPENLGEAKEIVVIGGFKENQFESKEMRIKCPSKYEGDSKAEQK